MWRRRRCLMRSRRLKWWWLLRWTVLCLVETEALNLELSFSLGDKMRLYTYAMVDVLCPIPLTWSFVRILTADYLMKCFRWAVAFAPTLPNSMISNGHMIYHDPHLCAIKKREKINIFSQQPIFVCKNHFYSLHFERYVFVRNETIFAAHSALPPIVWHLLA